MTIEVTTLSVEVVSKGIKDATDGLNALSVAIAKVDSGTTTAVTSTTKLGDAETKVASSSSNYADKLKIKADLLGKNTEYTASYMSSIKKLSDADTQLALTSARQIDSWKSLAVAQTEAIKMNKEYEKSALAMAETEEAAMSRISAAVKKSQDEMAKATAAQAATPKTLDSGADAAVWRRGGKNVRMTSGSSSGTGGTQQGFLDQEEQAKKVAEASKQQAAEVQKLRDSYDKLKATIDPYEAKFSKLETAETQLHKTYKAGVITLEEYQLQLTKVAASRAAVESAAAHSSSASAAAGYKSITASLKELDLTSAGVRNEMMVLGREFTSGNMSRVPGSMSLLIQRMGAMSLLANPLVVSFAAVGAAILYIGTVAYKAHEEAIDFQKALTLTGGYAATTTAQFTDLSNELGKIGTTGTHKAAEALIEVAGSGVFTADKVKLVTKAAIELEETTGQKISETVKTFEELQKSPVEAAMKLNEKYNFLTTSILLQADALKVTGDKHGEATVLMNAYADAVDTRTKQIEENAGIVEKAWRDVLKVMTAVGSAMGDIGRPTTTQSQIAELEAKKKKASELQGSSGDAAEGLLGSMSMMTQFSKSDQERLDRLKVINVEEQQAAAMKAQEVEATKQQVEAANRILEAKQKAKGVDSEKLAIERLNADLNRQNAEFLEKQNITKSASGQYSGSGYQLQLDIIHRKYKDVQPRGNEYDKDAEIKKLKGQEDAIKRQAEMDRLDNKSAYDARLEDKLEYVKKNAKIDDDMYAAEIVIQNQLLEIAKSKKNQTAAAEANNNLVKLEQEREISKKKYADQETKIEADKAAAIANFSSQLQTQLEQDQKTIDDSLAGAGLGDAAKSQMDKYRSLQESYNTSLKGLKTKKSNKEIDEDQLSTETEQLNVELELRTAKWKKYYEDLDEQKSNWQNGMTSAWANFQEQAKDISGQTKTMFTSAFSGMTDAIVTFATTGKLSFGSLTKTIIADIIKMQVQAAGSSIISSLITMGVTAWAGSTTSATAGTAEVGGSTTEASMYAANGAAFNSGGTRFFADGGTFTNGIVSSPTAFGMSGGTGVMGEAGPEAIVPLTRTADGSLGVRQTGGTSSTSSGNVNMSTQINIASDGSASTSTTTDAEKSATATQFAATMAAVAKNQIAMEQRQGGLLWKMVNGQK